MTTTRTNHGAEIPAVQAPKKKRTCNRHTDCDAADARSLAGGVYLYAEHCHDDCCEECFGK